MSFSALLIANRGEIAIRIARAAADLGLRTVAVHTEDDAASLHTRVADEAVALPGKGARAYLDVDAVIAAARQAGCDAVHPGYGFLAERADFAGRCAEEGLVFVGPSTEHLALFGDKVQAKRTMRRLGLPTIPGSDGPVSSDDSRVVLPDKEDVYNSIEGMMNHFKIIFEGIKVPPGEVYSYTEAANGELGFYLVSDGSGQPYKVRVRPPCFYLMSALDRMLEGAMVADIVPTFDGINMIGGEIDR